VPAPKFDDSAHQSHEFSAPFLGSAGARSFVPAVRCLLARGAGPGQGWPPFGGHPKGLALMGRAPRYTWRHAGRLSVSSSLFLGAWVE